MGGPLPPALICAALGLALSFARPASLWPALATLLAVALAASLIPFPSGWAGAIFLACWISILLTAAAVHLPKGIGLPLAVALAANAGLWTGTTIAAGGAPTDFLVALPLALVCLPGAWLARLRLAVAVKVVASWVVAVSILGATLPLAPTLLGYQADHME